jgi:hypothetical protein
MSSIRISIALVADGNCSSMQTSIVIADGETNIIAAALSGDRQDAAPVLMYKDL